MRFTNFCFGNESAKQEKTGIPTLCQVVICVTHLEKIENVIGNLNVNVKIHNWQCQGYETSMSNIHRIMSRLCDGNVKDPYWNVLCECHISIWPCRGYVNVNVTDPYDHVEVMWTSMSHIHMTMSRLCERQCQWFIIKLCFVLLNHGDEYKVY